MKLAIDVYYYENKAKTVGILFKDWRDNLEEKIILSHCQDIMPYESGNFFKRELPCIINLLDKIDLNEITEIIIDGYVHLDERGKPGLGLHLYDYLAKHKIVIGVAKSSFHSNENQYVKKIFRGQSKKPLFITSAGLSLDIAADNIKCMHGQFRIPTLLSRLDQQTKTI